MPLRADNNGLAFVTINTKGSASLALARTTQKKISPGSYSAQFHLDATTTSSEVEPRSKPRSGIAQQLLSLALASPIWTYVLVPQARASIVKTAEENGIPWMAAKEWLRSQEDTPWSIKSQSTAYENIQYPKYYKQSFHAYSDGNLSYDAAFEQELASRAIGARNFPKYGSNGEDLFRGAFDAALIKLGAGINPTHITSDSDDANNKNKEDVVIVDFGCGTGTSTRRLAKQYSQAETLVGIDLSPYFIDVGNELLKLAPLAMDDNNSQQMHEHGWITSIDSDTRIQLHQGDIANTNIPSNSVSIVNIGLVLHELPLYAAKEVVSEAHRILQPGGQLWISEMDFESPAYKAQRENALLFSLLRATEPYLDEYADGMPELRKFIAETFSVVKITAATGRHYALLAEKGSAEDDVGSKVPAAIEDTRFQQDGSYAIDDTHLKPWESKEEQ